MVGGFFFLNFEKVYKFKGKNDIEIFENRDRIVDTLNATTLSMKTVCYF